MTFRSDAEIAAIIATRIDGTICQFNDGAELLLGFSAAEMIGTTNPTVFLDPTEFEAFKLEVRLKYESRSEEQDPLRILAECGGYDAREWVIIPRDGNAFKAHLTLAAVGSGDVAQTNLLWVLRSIEDQKRIETDLSRKNQVLNYAEKITMMGHWQWDTRTNDVTWSRNLYNIFEVDPVQKLTYTTYFSFVHPDDKDFVSKSVERSINDKFFYELLHRIKLESGEVKTIQLLGEVITNSAGDVIELIGTCQDVTEQRMAELKFKGLLESAPDAMVIVNELGNIELINKQAELLFGYSREELIDKPVELLIPSRNHTAHTSHLGRYLRTPITRKMGEGKDLYGINKDGVEIPIQISLSPLRTEEGLLVSAAIRDITKQKKAEHKILESKKGLEVLTRRLTAQNKQLADFAHITSHNLRAPVTNLNALLDFYQNTETEEQKALLFEKFKTVIDHLTQTLNTLIEALKTKNQGVQKMETVVFEEVLKKTKEILSGQILEANCKIITDFSDFPSIQYNPMYMESIFLNLMSNAIKYRSPDRDPEILISSTQTDGVRKLKFTDNGLGIDLKRHGHKLFGLNKVFHRHPEAKGVGLFMTKVQIVSMGGSIFAESQVNEGSTFHINFNE